MYYNYVVLAFIIVLRYKTIVDLFTRWKIVSVLGKSTETSWEFMVLTTKEGIAKIKKITEL